MRPRIAISGNCQAQALTSLTLALELPVDVRILPAVFDLQAFATEENEAAICGADFVFNQLVSQTYPVEFIRPGTIRQRISGKSFSWPNIYFDGYFPGVGYMYAADGSKVTGPLSDYHFSQIFAAWNAGVDPERAWERTALGEMDEVCRSPVEKSFARLRQRDRLADIQIEDFLATRFRYEKLFYSMNHPGNIVLVEMLRRMMALIDVPMPDQNWIDQRLLSFPYTLDKIDIPAFPSVHQRYMLRWKAKTVLTGVALVMRDGLLVEGSDVKIYSGPELAEAFYAVYERSRTRGVIHNSNNE